MLEVTKHQHRIAQITDVDRCIHRSDQSVLSKYENGQHAKLAEIAQQLMHLQNQESPIRHCIQVSVQAVDHDDASAVLFDALTNDRSEFTRRQLRRIDLLESNESRVDERLEWQTQGVCSRLDRAAAFVERKKDRLFSALSGSDRV